MSVVVMLRYVSCCYVSVVFVACLIFIAVLVVHGEQMATNCNCKLLNVLDEAIPVS